MVPHFTSLFLVIVATFVSVSGLVGVSAVVNAWSEDFVARNTDLATGSGKSNSDNCHLLLKQGKEPARENGLSKLGTREEPGEAGSVCNS